MTRRLPLLLLLLAMGTGCPEFWGRDGIIEEAAHRDSMERMRPPPCTGNWADWNKLCVHAENPEKTCPARCLDKIPGRKK